MKHESISITNCQLWEKGTRKFFEIQAWQQSDNNEPKMNIQIQTISRKSFIKKREKKERKPNVNLVLGMLLIVWISAAVPPGCCPLSPANYSAG